MPDRNVGRVGQDRCGVIRAVVVNDQKVTDAKASIVRKEKGQAARFVPQADKAQDICGPNGSSPVGDTSQIAPMQPSTGQKPPPPKPLPIGLPKPDQATRRFRKRSDRAGMRRPRFRNPGAQGLLSRLLYGHQLVQKGLELAPKIGAGQGKGDRCLQKSNL